MDPTQRFVRRHQHDLTSAQVRTPADFVSHHSQDIPETVGSTRSFLFKSYCLPQLAKLFFSCCLWSSYANVNVSHSIPFVLVFPDVTARCVRIPAHQLCSLVPCTSLNTSSFPLVHSLCLGDSVFVRIHPCFSRQGSLNDRADSLSAFIVTWLCRFSMRCKRCASWAASSVSVSFNVRRQDVEPSGFNLWRSFHHNPWRWGVPLLLCQL